MAEPTGLAVVWEPFRTLVRHRGTIASFVRRDLQGRYASSMLGMSWALIQPLLLLALYTLVFSVILRVRLGGDGGIASFALYLFCGMLPWIAFSDAVSRSTHVVLEHVTLIKRVVFPSEILPVYVVAATFVMELVGLAVLLVAVQLVHLPLRAALVALPVVCAFQLMLTLGIAWVLASLNVFFRDIGQVLPLALTFGMFLTPIFYTPEMLPARLRPFMALNPLAAVIDGYRRVLLDGAWPVPRSLAVLGGTALVVFALGHWFFVRSKRAFVDVM